MMQSRPPDINILPERYRPGLRVSAAAGILIVVGAALLFGLVPLYVALGMAQSQTAALQARLDQAYAAMGQSQEDQQRLEQVSQEIEQTRAQIEQLHAELGTVSLGRVRRSDGIAAIAAALVPQVYLGTVTQAGNVLTFRGEADGETLVLDYARALQSSGQFANVRVLSIVNPDPASQRVEFSIEMEQ
jgi:Tfp pilus assembly protein PilN